MSEEEEMIYPVHSPQFHAFMYTGRRTPTTDEVCAALDDIKNNNPDLEATEMASLLRYNRPNWILENLDWVELQRRLDD